MSAEFDPYHRWLGIPPEKQPPNHYSLLAIEPFEDSPDVIQSAADQRMSHLRTFQTGKHGDLSQKLLNEAAAAKVCLLSPQKKAAYDNALRQQLAAEEAAPQVDPGLAGLFEKTQQAGQGTAASAAGKMRPATLAGIAAVAVAGVLLVVGLFIWRRGSGDETPDPTVAAAPSGDPTERPDQPESKTTPGPPAPDGPAPDRPAPDRPAPDRPAPDRPDQGTATSVAGPGEPDPGQTTPGTKSPTPPSDPIAATTPPEPKPDEPTVDQGPSEPEPAPDPQPQPPTAPQKRLPVPSAEAQKEITGQIHQAYDFAGAKTSAQKLQLARRLFDLGGQAQAKPAERFVLLRKAMELAGDGGDAALMLEAVEAIGTDFEVSVLDVKQKVLMNFAKAATSAERVGSLVEGALPLVDQALAEGRCDVAYQLVESTYRACTGSRGNQHRKRVYDRRGEVRKQYQQWQQFQDALSALKDSPDDAEANLTVGRWYCLRQGDWEQGLPYLAKCSDEGLKAAAGQELNSPPTETNAQIKLADAWWDLAQAAKDEAKAALLLHAGTWYEKAQPNVTSVVITDKLGRRLEEIRKLARPAAAVTARQPRPPKPSPRGKTVKPFDPTTAELLATLRGHTKEVRSVAFSPDSSILVSSSHDKTVKFWDVARGQLRGVLPPFKHGELRVAFSPKGSLLAVANGDQAVSLWNPATGQLRGILDGHSKLVASVTFSPDGSRLASGSDDFTAILWDVQSGRPEWVTEGHGHRVRSVAFSPDGSVLASGAGQEPVRLWDVATGELRRTLDVRTQYAQSMAFSPDGAVLACATNQGVILANAQTGQRLHSLGGHQSYVTSVAFSVDGATLASASDNGTVRLWDVAAGELRRTFEEHTAGVYSVAFSPDGSLLASGNRDGTIKLWGTDPSKKAPTAQPPKTTPPAAEPAMPKLAPSGRVGTVNHFDPASAELLGVLHGHNSWVRALAFDRDGSDLISGGEDKTVRFWDLATGQPRGTLPPFSDKVWSLALSPDGSVLAVANRNASVSLLDSATAQLRAVLPGHVGDVWSVTFSPDGALLASGGSDHTVKLWNVANGRLRRTLEGHAAEVGSVAFSPDGSTLASAADNVKLWDPAKGELRQTLEGYPGRIVAFAPDGSLLAGGHGSSVMLWNARTGEIQRRLQGHRSGVGCVAFHPNGSLLASGSADKTVKLWNTGTGELLRTLEVPDKTTVESVAFSPQGSLLAAGNLRTIQLWGTDPSKTPPKPQPAKATPPSETGRAPSSPAPRRKAVRRITFRDPSVLDSFVSTRPKDATWTVAQGQMLIQTRAGGKQHVTYGEYFRSISSVTIRGGIVAPGKKNFRAGIGPIWMILNWEGSDENHFRDRGKNDGGTRTTTRPGALSPGKIHEIRLVQTGEDVVVTIDGKQHYKTTATLEGTVTVNPAYGSTIAVQEIVIEGEPDPTVVVTGPLHGKLQPAKTTPPQDTEATGGTTASGRARIEAADKELSNLIPNASFEEAADGKPAGWKMAVFGGNADFEHSDQGRTGKHSVAISSEDGANVAWTVIAPLVPNSKYRLTGWIKTEKVQTDGKARGPSLYLHSRRKATKLVTGTSDWTRVELIFDSNKSDKMQIDCLFGGWGQSTGKAWYDDLKLERLSGGSR